MQRALTALAFAAVLASLGCIARAAEPSVREPYGIGLEGFAYPYPVHMLPLTNDGEPVRMAYMDVAPAQPRHSIRKEECRIVMVSANTQICSNKVEGVFVDEELPDLSALASNVSCSEASDSPISKLTPLPTERRDVELSSFFQAQTGGHVQGDQRLVTDVVDAVEE